LRQALRRAPRGGIARAAGRDDRSLRITTGTCEASLRGDAALAATTLGIKKLELGANGRRVIFRPQPKVEPLTIIKMIHAQPRAYALDGQDKLRFKMPLEGTAERLRAAHDLLSSLGIRKAA
jgi:hypothetical protein